MASVGVRELRQNASALLRRVGAGETIEVTDRGRPIAILSPMPRESTLDRLRAAGEVAASGPLEDVLGAWEGDPLEWPDADELPLQRLTRLRANER